jgi:hypothetical protein
MCTTSVFFKLLSKVNNHPLGESGHPDSTSHRDGLHFGRKGGGRNGSSYIDLIKEYIYWRDSISRPITPQAETKSESQKLKKEKKTFLRTNSNTKDFLCHDNSRGQFVEHNGYVGPICRTQWISGRISSYDTLLAGKQFWV